MDFFLRGAASFRTTLCVIQAWLSGDSASAAAGFRLRGLERAEVLGRTKNAAITSKASGQLGSVRGPRRWHSVTSAAGRADPSGQDKGKLTGPALLLCLEFVSSRPY